MQIIFSEEFRKEFRKIRNKDTRLNIIKQLKKIEQVPESGKPLRYNLRGHRTIRIARFRIVYRIEKEFVIINCFDHRKDVYE